MKKLNEKINYIKSKLFLNGDWLYVTLDKQKVDNEVNLDEIDLNEALLNENENLAKIKDADEQTLKLMYERVLIAESSSRERADTVRDKAKALLGTSTFVSAILFGISTYFIPLIFKNPFYILVFESILLFLMFAHFTRSLMAAMSVLLRESYFEFPPAEILNIKGTLTEIYKKNIAVLLACIAETQKFTTSKVNKLILGQDSFRYGLCYLFIIFFIHNLTIFLDLNNLQKTSNVSDSLFFNGKFNSLEDSNMVNKRNILKLEKSLESLKFKIDSINIEYTLSKKNSSRVKITH